jgi:uncharacterized membrane protein
MRVFWGIVMDYKRKQKMVGCIVFMAGLAVIATGVAICVLGYINYLVSIEQLNECLMTLGPMCDRSQFKPAETMQSVGWIVMMILGSIGVWVCYRGVLVSSAPAPKTAPRPTYEGI